MDAKELKDIIDNHKLWLDSSNNTGEKADLRRADLNGFDLRGVNLSGADLSKVDLRGANLKGADLIVLHLPLYIAYIQRDGTRIGCKYLSNKEWASLSDVEIAEMDSNALESWTAYKSIIFAAMDTLTMTMESK